MTTDDDSRAAWLVLKRRINRLVSRELIPASFTPGDPLHREGKAFTAALERIGRGLTPLDAGIETRFDEETSTFTVSVEGRVVRRVLPSQVGCRLLEGGDFAVDTTPSTLDISPAPMPSEYRRLDAEG